VLRRDLLYPIEQSHRADDAGDTPLARSVNMLELDFAQASDRGMVRDHNEDYLGYALPEMSGAVGRPRNGCLRWPTGWVARIKAKWLPVPRWRPCWPGSAARAMGNSTPRCCRAWCGKPTQKWFEAGIGQRDGHSAMATTLVACALRFDRVVVSHVGDSRCYRIRHRHAEA